MAITQVSIATVSDELIQYLKEQFKNGTLDWSDISDTPTYTGQDGKFLRAQSGGGSSSMVWADLPAAGLIWQSESTNFQATDKVGILASNGITITLPATPTEGTLIAVTDHLGEFDTKPVNIVASGGLTIEGDTSLLLDLRNAYVQVIFDGNSWELAQVNHPFNIQEITEESFPGGSINYTLSRVPPSRSSILVTSGGYVIPTSQYSVTGNTLSFGNIPSSSVCVRHIGIPSSIRVSDTPIGAMLYFPNGEAVDGWLDCTGGSISRGVYPDLVRYLSKNPDAETATLPDARGNFIRTWAHGDLSKDQTDPQAISTYLKGNEWGKWLDTTEDSTSGNLWDNDLSTRTTVLKSHGYVGYRFDAPASMISANITSDDAVSVIHLPSSVQLKASHDGITWVEASAPYTGTMQGQMIPLEVTVLGEYRYWAVFGAGGVTYPGGSDYYWGVSALTFEGTTTHRKIGGHQSQSAGPLEMLVAGSAAGAGQVQSGTGATAVVTGGTGLVTGGKENRPDNRSYVLRIKAFHFQSGNMASSEVTALRNEVSRLSAMVNDRTSYVGPTAPEDPADNSRWYDTTSGRTYIRFNDGDSYQWVDDSPQNSSTGGGSSNTSKVLAVGTRTSRMLNERFADVLNILDFGAYRNSGQDSKVAFELAGEGPIFVPTGSYTVSSGNYAGNIYFSFGPVSITGAATGIVVKNLLI